MVLRFSNLRVLVAVFCALGAAIPAGSAPLSERRTRLGAAQRAPLPETVEVLRVAPAESAIWFLGLDHSVDPATTAVYSWTSSGVLRYALPELPKGSVPTLETDRRGDALLLAGGRLWRAEAGSFHAVETAPVERIAGGDGFWLLTASNEITYLENARVRARRLTKVDGQVTAWTAGRFGDLWFATADGLVRRLRPGQQPERVFEADSAAVALFADPTEQLWIALADGRLARQVAGTVDWLEAPAGVVHEMAQDSQGNLMLTYAQPENEAPWLITQPRSLRATLGFRKVTFDGVEGAVRDLAQDHLGGTWVAAGLKGAWRLEGTGELNWPMGDARAVAEMAAFRSGVVRAAASGPGKQAQALTNFLPLPGAQLTFLTTARQTLPNNQVSCAVSDGADIWFGTGYTNISPDGETQAGSGVVRWDHRQATTFTAGLPSQTVQACAYHAGSGALWFGGPNGISRYSGGTFTNFLPGVGVLDLLVRGDELWVASAGAGVYRLSALTGAQQLQVTAGGARVTSLAAIPGGDVWAGTAAGLYRFNGTSFVAEGTASVLNTDYVMDLQVDDAGNLWVAVWNKSVFRRTPAGVFTQHLFGPVFSGLRRVYAMGKDPFGNVYFGHGNFGGFGTPNAAFSVVQAAGISAANPTFLSYSQATNGLPGNAVISFGADASGIWLGSPGGGAWRIGGPFSMTGFPAAMQSFSRFTSPLLVDLDHDRDLEIVAGDDSGRIYAFRPDGTTMWTYDTRNALPVPAGATRGAHVIHSSPAAGDVDGDGEIDIVVGLGGLQDTASYNGLLILSRTGQFKRLLNTFDSTGLNGVQLDDGFPEAVFATPVLANLDADPELEIVVGAFDNMLRVWNGDGTPVYQRDDDGDGRFDEDYLSDTTPYTPFRASDDAPGWKNVDDDGDGLMDEGLAADDDEDGKVDEDYWEWPFNARDTIFASALVADLNGDGTNEIIFGHDYSGGTDQEFARGGVIRVFNAQGRNIAGFPRGNLEQVIWSSPVAVDLDNDGRYEFLHGSGIEMGTVGDSAAEQLIGRLVYAWRSNGQAFRTCTANTGAGCFATVEGRSFSSFAVGDLDNDGTPELVIATTPLRDKQNRPIGNTGGVVTEDQSVGQQLYVFRTDGTLFPGFPVRPAPRDPGSPLFGSPILADVNNDGFLDIILSVRFGLIVFDRNGHVIPGMGIWENLQEDNMTREINSTAAVADIDLDGNLELIWLAPTDGGNLGNVRVVRLSGSNATYQRSWPQWRRGIGRNALFGPLISLVQGWESGGTLNINVQAFAGRNPLAAVTVDLSALGATAILAPQANSTFFGTVNVAALAPGRYHIPVTATDSAGRSSSQTLIFIKRGGTRQIVPAVTTLDFGAVTRGETAQRQLTIVNTGSEAVTVTSLTTNNTEFFVMNPVVHPSLTAPTPILPQVIQPGGTFPVTVRYRPGAASGTRTATLSIQSTDATLPTRTVTLTGSTTGAVSTGCSVTLQKLTFSNTPSGNMPSAGESGELQVTTNPAGCAWTATSDSPWLQIFPLSGTGTMKLLYTAFPNLTVRVRSARVSVNGTVLVMIQDQSPLVENRRFIAAMFFAAFGRYPDTASIDFHTGTLADTALKAADFFTSAEFNQNGRFIAGVYLGLLKRLPEYGGWQFQRNAIASGGSTPQALAGAFLQTPEFILQNGTLSNENFIRLLFQNILGRAPSAGELTFQVSTLGAGGLTERAQKATEFLNIPEYTLRAGPALLTNLLYFLLLQRDPTLEEYNAMVTRIPSGATRDQLVPVIREILALAEFRGIIL